MSRAVSAIDFLTERQRLLASTMTIVDPSSRADHLWRVVTTGGGGNPVTRRALATSVAPGGPMVPWWNTRSSETPLEAPSWLQQEPRSGTVEWYLREFEGWLQRAAVSSVDGAGHSLRLQQLPVEVRNVLGDQPLEFLQRAATHLRAHCRQQPEQCRQQPLHNQELADLLTQCQSAANCVVARRHFGGELAARWVSQAAPLVVALVDHVRRGATLTEPLRRQLRELLVHSVTTVVPSFRGVVQSQLVRAARSAVPALGESSKSQALGMRPEAQALGMRPEAQALGMRPEVQAVGVRPEVQAVGVVSKTQAVGVVSKSQSAVGRQPVGWRVSLLLWVLLSMLLLRSVSDGSGQTLDAGSGPTLNAGSGALVTTAGNTPDWTADDTLLDKWSADQLDRALLELNDGGSVDLDLVRSVLTAPSVAAGLTESPPQALTGDVGDWLVDDTPPPTSLAEERAQLELELDDDNSINLDRVPTTSGVSSQAEPPPQAPATVASNGWRHQPLPPVDTTYTFQSFA